MTKLSFEKYSMPAADLGKDSCLPDIHVNSYIRAPISLSDNINAEDGKYIGKGMVSTLLPYSITDGYNRQRRTRDFNAAILENEYIKAVFLPELGGRLWSLYDKTLDLELLYKNDVFQPANLALRNAWFSGGVEWNVGIKGHNPLTCSPLFAQRMKNKSGDEVLRMYEFERIRGIVYIIEASLKERALAVKITIENTDDNDKYMYWWSNIAVPETPMTRVITPCDDTFFCAYTDGAYFLDKTSMPLVDGKDITYSSNSPRSRDFFFDIPDKNDKWIAAVDKDGKGLLQFSDPLLKGRKLFVWGTHQGGRHWNEWLSQDAGAYVEIQAGLLKTQLEHFVMPAQSTITWQECYCAAEIDPKIAHGDFKNAAVSVDAIVKTKKDLLSSEIFNIDTYEAIHAYGSGWGALENKIRHTPISSICEFPDNSMNQEQADWLCLLAGEGLPSHCTNNTITSYVVGKEWIKLMEQHPKNDWYYYNHLGIMKYANGDHDKAAECFITSIQIEDNAWARRNLAQIQKNIYMDVHSAAENMKAAIKLMPDYIPLAVEVAYTLMNDSQFKEYIDLFDSFPLELKNNGRLKMVLGACYAQIGNTDEARRIINPELQVDDIKEGEYALSAIWVDIYRQVLANELDVDPKSLTEQQVFEKYPLPRALDYRMH